LWRSSNCPGYSFDVDVAGGGGGGGELGGGAERGGGGGAKGGGGGEGTRLGISVAPTLAMVWFGVTLYADPYEAIILPWAL